MLEGRYGANVSLGCVMLGVYLKGRQKRPPYIAPTQKLEFLITVMKTGKLKTLLTDHAVINVGLVSYVKGML